MTNNKPSVFILGGAGFIGSHITEKFVHENWNVTVLDGLMPNTGGHEENIAAFRTKLKFINTPVENTKELHPLVEKSDVIIDSMAWTAHTSAFDDPLYDIQLNLKSHIHLINALRRTTGKRVFFLGSRGQYGNVKDPLINENTPMIPEDVQGANKLCAESLFRIFSKTIGFSAVSVRLGNVYGPRQMVGGKDIGLVGNFIRDILTGKTIKVYGGERIRYVAYARDVATVIFDLAQKQYIGFQAFNLAGQKISIGNLVRHLIKVCGRGKIEEEEMPSEIKAMDIGNSLFSEDKLKGFIGKLPETPINDSFEETVKYFKGKTNDFQM